jgi:hypothetical protein
MKVRSKDFAMTGAIAAVPAGNGGVKYIFPDGSAKIVEGGYSTSYRFNSPGLHAVGGPSARDAFIRHVGGIGYARSSKNATPMVVFADRQQADRGLSIVLTDNAATLANDRKHPHQPTVGEMLAYYNGGPKGGGDPSYVAAVLGLANGKEIGGRFTGHELYSSLTDEQKAQLREAIFQQEGFYSPQDQMNPTFPHRVREIPASHGDASDPNAPSSAVALNGVAQDEIPGEAQSGAPSHVASAPPTTRTALEDRAGRLGIDYAAYLPTHALLADIHEREAETAPPEALDDTADGIEREMNAIGVPLLRDPDGATPPPEAAMPLSRPELMGRAAALRLDAYPEARPTALMAQIHEHEAETAPPQAADALADRQEREIDQAAGEAGLPWAGATESGDEASA